MCIEGTGHHVGKAFDLIERFTTTVKNTVSIPVIAKMTPNITDMTEPAIHAKNGGADAISAMSFLSSSFVGLARAVPRHFASAEEEAKAARRGLWENYVEKKEAETKAAIDAELLDARRMVEKAQEDARRIVDEFAKFARMPEPERAPDDIAQLLTDAVTYQAYTRATGYGRVRVLSAAEFNFRRPTLGRN